MTLSIIRDSKMTLRIVALALEIMRLGRTTLRIIGLRMMTLCIAN
jgi:hypothetical protein